MVDYLFTTCAVKRLENIQNSVEMVRTAYQAAENQHSKTFGFALR